METPTIRQEELDRFLAYQQADREAIATVEIPETRPQITLSGSRLGSLFFDSTQRPRLANRNLGAGMQSLVH